MNKDHEIVATLIAGAHAKLSPALVKDFAAALEESGGKSVRTAWLAEEKAADIFYREGLDGEGPPSPCGRVEFALANSGWGQKIDVLIQPAAIRRKKLLLADMESTIIEQEMLDEMAAYLGFGAETAAITYRAMNGEVDFAAALKERVALLKGQPADLLDQMAKRITLMPGAESLIATMKANRATCWLVSGGFTCFAQIVAQRLGFDRYFANELLIENGILTGKVAEPILDKNSKKTLLEKAAAELKISLAETLTVGDGANDIPMLVASNAGDGLGVAYHAKPKAREAVPHQINHGDLTALLYAQGYSLTSSGFIG